MSHLDAVLPEGIERQYGPPPCPPSDFDNYVLPVHSVKPLQLLNVTLPVGEEEDHLLFYEKDHIYTYSGTPASSSVSTLAHEFQPHFDPVAAILLMKKSRSQSYPRLEYVVDAREVKTNHDLVSERGAMLVCGGKTVGVLLPHSVDRIASGVDIRSVLYSTRLRTPGSEATEDDQLYTFERAMTDEEILDAWKKNGLLASNKGTEGHYLCELFLNGLACRWWEPEMRILFDFVEKQLLPRKIVAFQTEKEIFCKDANIGGSIDAILFDAESKVYHILDFKRSDKLADDMHSKFRKRMLPPLSHLDDCRGASYALQVSIYQYILERDYGMSIGDRILLSIHPDRPFSTSVPYLFAEVDYIMKKQISLVAAQKRAVDLHPRFACSLSGFPVVDTVRLKETGELAMRKAALLKEVEFEEDDTARSDFEAEVRLHLSPVDPPLAVDCIQWKKRVPEEGYPPFL